MFFLWPLVLFYQMYRKIIIVDRFLFFVYSIIKQDKQVLVMSPKGLF